MTGPTDHLTDTSFDDFDLPSPLRQGLVDAGFSRCTPIQAATLPLTLAGRDVAGQAQTGTGKTAAFLLTIFAHLLRREPADTRKPTQPRAFVVAPTRELAMQIHKDAELLGKHCGFRIALAYGGTDYERQRDRIAGGSDLLIGTPGRLIDYLKQGIYDLKAVEVMVLDEADRMFDLGFIADIRYLFRRMPPPAERLSMLFSATLSLRVTELAYEHMNGPERIEIRSEQVTADRVEQVLYHPANNEKIPLLIGLLRRIDPPRTMVFVNTKRAADRVWAYLAGNGFQAAVLSGDVRQQKRQRLLGDFQAGKLPILIATDVAARGLHVPNVSHVFNFDLPQSGEDYVHRIGRTARAGESGHAVSFACEDYAFSVPEIEAYIDAKLPTEAVTAELLPELSAPARVDRSDRVVPRPDSGGRTGGDRGDRRDGRRQSRSPAGGPAQRQPEQGGQASGAGGGRKRRRRGRSRPVAGSDSTSS